jgi:S-sulfo-L-cysteine synthase (O-acetyl-L-serine-dependent)
MMFNNTYIKTNSLLDRAVTLQNEVGNTPLIELKGLHANEKIRLYAKQEWKQLGASVKSRPAYQIILDAIRTGELSAGKKLLDATSGNTGIAYASIAQKLGIGVTLCLPENASKERIEILTGLGAELILTSKFEGTDGAQKEARELASRFPETYYYADQYNNDNNWKAHYETTAVEIYLAQPGITHFVAGLGTTGTFVGTARRLREMKASIQLISLQPDTALHALEGWKHMETAKVPGIYDPSVADRNLEISTEDAFAMLKKMATGYDMMLSPSSAANIVGALKVMDGMDEGIVVTILPDNADKYSEVINKIL